MAILETTDVVSGYGDAQILDGVSLEVRENEIVSVIGPNGAGKSTLMKAISGLIDCWAGSIVLMDSDVTDASPDELARQGQSYVPQQDNIFPNLTVRENLEMGAYVEKDVPESTLEDVFDHFPILQERENQRAGTLSGGEQQMLAMGAALMTDPEIMLIDEPSAALAPELVEYVFDQIVTIKEGGTSVLMVEQNAREALQRSDRGYVLDQGENRFVGPAGELLESEEVRDLYLGQSGG